MPVDDRGERQAERPVAARAEEADLAGAVGDLAVVPVLRAQVDAARDEPEVAAAHQAQQARTGPARPRRPSPDLRRRARVVPAPPRSRRRTRRRGTAVTIPKILYSVFIGAPQLILSASRLVGNGDVVVANGASPIALSASGVVLPGLLGREEPVVLLRRHRAQLEVHHRVVRAAQLGAAADVGARRRGSWSRTG